MPGRQVVKALGGPVGLAAQGQGLVQEGQGQAAGCLLNGRRSPGLENAPFLQEARGVVARGQGGL